MESQHSLDGHTHLAFKVKQIVISEGAGDCIMEIASEDYDWAEERHSLDLAMRSLALQCVDRSLGSFCDWKGNSNPFTTKGSYDMIKPRDPPVVWSKIIWNKFSPPKHSFCAWLGVRNKLPITKILSGSERDGMCCWCKSAEESCEHLVFGCRSMRVLEPCLEMQGMRVRVSSWEELFRWFSQKTWKCKAEKLAISFVICAVVYEVWRNRNNNIFRGLYMESSQVISLVDRAFENQD